MLVGKDFVSQVRAFASVKFVHALRLDGNFAPLARLERDAVAASRFVVRPHKRVRAVMLGAAFKPPQHDASTSRQRPRDSPGETLAFLLSGVAIRGTCNIAHIKRN